MKISHEVPFCLMEQSRSFNDYEYSLVHLFEEHADYYDFFKESLKQGRSVLLDNSVFELEEAFDPDRFAYWIKELNPTEYFIPDVMGDFEKTHQSILNWNANYDVPGKKIGVVHGKTTEEAIKCYEKIYPLVDKIAIGFNCPHYENDSDQPILEQWMYGRQSFLEIVVESCEKPIHLLGCSLPQEFMYYANNPDFKMIDTIDTSNPIVHAINNIRYDNVGLSSKVSTKLVEYLNVDLGEIDPEILDFNINKFRAFCS
jgi:hypothetical protein